MVYMATSKEQRGPGRPPKYPKPAGAERSAKRFQVALRPEMYDALEAFRKAQEFAPERSAIIEKLIERFLIEKGFYAPPENEG